MNFEGVPKALNSSALQRRRYVHPSSGRYIGRRPLESLEQMPNILPRIVAQSCKVVVGSAVHIETRRADLERLHFGRHSDDQMLGMMNGSCREGLMRAPYQHSIEPTGLNAGT